MSEFKVPPYVYWYPSDWLNDPEVRRLPGDVKGFYIDLICQLHYCFPYGYCSLLNHKKTSKLQKQVNQNSNQEVNLRVELLLTISVSEQLKLAENIEDQLHKYLPYDLAETQRCIGILEEMTIISRSNTGIIYVRRLVKDFKKRVVAYLNGSKGGNPNVKTRKKTIKKPKKIIDKILEGKDLRKQVNQKPNQPAYPNADLKYNKEMLGREGVRATAEKPIFMLQDIYDKSFSELQKISYSKTLTESGFLLWKEFVNFVVENNYEDLFITKFIKPPDFQKVYDGGFVKEKWEPVLKEILGTGVNQQQNLFYRIPQYLKYINKGIKGISAGGIETEASAFKFDPKKHQ